MNKILITIFLLICFGFSSLAQEATEEQPAKEKDKPVRRPWESGYLIDAQTSFIPEKRTLNYVIQHKFGTVANGISDLYGIYAAGANIRLGIEYVPVKNVQIGYGLTKKNMYNDFNAKWTVLEQTRQNAVPVSVTLFGLMAIDGRSKDFFETKKYYHSSSENPLTLYDFRSSQRFSYFSQLIIGRKFNEALSLQAGVSFSHFNSVDATADHDKIGAHFAGRYKFSPQSSFIFNYDVPLKIKDISEQREWVNHPKPNLAAGWEISTTTHQFQIYVSSSSSIVPQDMMLYNQLDWKDKGLAVGFVITRLWSF